MAKLTQNGLEFDKLEQSLATLRTIATQKFADILPLGETLDLDESSVLGRVLAIVAEPDAKNEEVIFDMYASFDPEQATGLAQDKLYRLRDMVRLDAEPAIAMLHMRGVLGTTIPAASSVGSKVTGDKFLTTGEVQFDSSKCHGVCIDFTTVAENSLYTLEYQSETGVNVYPILSVSANATDDKESLAKRFSSIINNISSVLTSFVDSDDLLHIKYLDPNISGRFLATGTCTILQSYQVTYSYSSTFTAVKQLANTLTVIQSPVLGWLEVTNPFDGIASVPAESDEDFRLRYKAKITDDSTASIQAMYSELYALSGVRFVNIQENVQDSPIENRGGHGIAVVVLGGSDEDIAQVIRRNLSCGCFMDGEVERTVYDVNNRAYFIRFNRPELVPIQIKISLSTDRTFPANGVVQIQDAIVAHFDKLNVGDDVMLSHLFTPINTVKGQSVNSLTISRVGSPLSNENLEINYNELATISYENIKV